MARAHERARTHRILAYLHPDLPCAGRVTGLEPVSGELALRLVSLAAS